MNRNQIINLIGSQYLETNIENSEYSYVKAAGSKRRLRACLGREVPEHYKLDIRMKCEDVVVLIETKPVFVESDQLQLKDYYDEEVALFGSNKVICILANTNNDDIKVWQGDIVEANVLSGENVLQPMSHYVSLFQVIQINDRERVLKNTFDLNILLHKMDIGEPTRSQFVGTCLLYIKEFIKQLGAARVDSNLIDTCKSHWQLIQDIRGEIETTLDRLLSGSRNKDLKIKLLKKNVLDDQKVKKLSKGNWITVLSTILKNIYQYIDADSSEGQDILNLFFIAFNKYTGKADKNQAFTPDHITDFMTRIAEVNRTSVVLDPTCGSGSFLVQAMVKELADCSRGTTDLECSRLKEIVTGEHIYGIENEEKAFGLSTTNMLIHGDGNSNIEFASCFKSETFIRNANPDIILMNPPYNAKPIGIPDEYKGTWNAEGKEDPTKGMVFIHFLSDVVKRMNEERERQAQPRKEVKLLVLLPIAAAIGRSSILTEEKKYMLRYNTLNAVFTLPAEIFYPGASVNACCMFFTLGRPHDSSQETFFGYYRNDGFKKKKNLGRVEQFDNENRSIWRQIEAHWIELFRNREQVDGLSALAAVTGEDEWLCEAYMKTDYSEISSDDFQRTLNNYISYLVKEGIVYED